MPATPEQEDFHLVNATGTFATPKPDMCFFDHAESFTMIRGRHIDLCVLGGLQVSEKGDLAGWQNPARGLPENIGNIGGSMDLAVGAKKVIVAMMHVTNNGEPKILKECTYPITARGVVKLIVTDLAVISVTPEGLVLEEVATGLTADDIQSVTEAKLIVSPELMEVQF